MTDPAPDETDERATPADEQRVTPPDAGHVDPLVTSGIAPPDEGSAPAIGDPDAAARGAAYGLFATLFDEPDADVCRAFASGEVETLFDELLSRTSLPLATTPELRPDDDHELLRARFNDVFGVGYPEPPVSLYESDHREDGWRDVNLDVARAYDYFGVSVPEDRREHHDHLRLELEFAGSLARWTAVRDDDDLDRARLAFLERHLRHLATGVAEAVVDEPNTGVYGPLSELLVAFVSADHEDLAADLDGDPREEVSR